MSRLKLCVCVCVNLFNSMHFDYSNIITVEKIFQAFAEFKKGKTKRLDVQLFERYLEDNLFDLYEDLKRKTYKHGSYKSFYVKDPKVRHIHKASVRDRIVHHLVSKVLETTCDPKFYFHSYSCRKEKGTHKAVREFIKLARKASKNNTSVLYVLKCDIKKFFASIDHEVLLRILQSTFKDKDFLWLLSEIVESFHTKTTISKGMPIGNLTSQLFANIYLNPLDQYMKHVLKVKYYGRYADDFVILSKEKIYLQNLTPQIEKYLSENLRLALHPNKLTVRDYYLGIDFLGYVVFPHFVLPRTKTKRRVFRKIAEKIELVKSNKLSLESLNQSMQSYLGYFSHADTFRLSQDLKRLIVV